MSDGNDGRSHSVFRAEGVFDVRAARRVAEYVEAVAGRGHVRIDLTKVTEFDDFGIAVLAQAVKHLRLVNVRVVGLRTHQFRLLKYFGVDAAVLSGQAGGVGQPSP